MQFHAHRPPRNSYDAPKGARYHTMMKRSTRKIVIRRESLRILTGIEVAHVGAGNAAAAALMDSAGAATGCPMAAQAVRPDA